MDGNYICIVITFLFLQMAQILGKNDKVNDDGQIRKPPIIAGRFVQICVHIKIRAAETDILFSFIRIQVLKITAFPQKIGNIHIQYNVTHDTVFLLDGYNIFSHTENFLPQIIL